MEVCRICSNNGRHLQPIFKSTKLPTIAEMIAGIANVKIWKGDGHPDKICRLCKNKLCEAYTFKMQIEKSDRIFRNVDIDKKQITFNDLTDLLVEIQSLNPELLCAGEGGNNGDLKICFDVKQNVAYYHDTLIKGLDVKDINNKGYGINCNETMDVKYFLDTIKCDFDNYNDDFVAHDDYDDDYVPPSKSKAHKKIDKHKKRKFKGLKKHSKFKPIKPIILEDLKLVSSKGRYKPRPKGEGQKRLKYGREQICPYCGRIIKAMKVHLMTHTEKKSYNCSQCPKSFYRENNLREHLKLHTGEKDFKCHLCVAAFHSKMLLRSHLISHANIRKFVCQICSKGFKRKCALKKHEMRHSSANRIYKCDQCNMSCFEKWQLKHHMRVHTRERPYNCEICTQAYSYKHDFNNHCFKKHGVFVKGRSINIMNKDVLLEERALMREVLENGEDPFKGPRAAIQYQLAVSALNAKVMSDIKMDYVI